MAQQAGITSIHAEYGHIINSTSYELLKEVTHWTNEDVQREADFKNQKKDIKQADFTISKFDELLNLFNYIPF